MVIQSTDTVRLNALFRSRRASDVAMRYLLRTYATSRDECYARRLGNSVLSTKIFAR